MPVEQLGVRDPEPDALLGFLREMEFATLTKRIAEGLGRRGRRRDRAEARAADARQRAGRQLQGRGEASGAAATSATPQAAVAASRQGGQGATIDRSKYETVTELPQLEAWIAEARAAGRFAFDTETTSLDPMQAEFVGFSMAVAPGKACYVPLGHRAGGGSFDFGDGDIKQVPVGEALAVLKPLLEDPVGPQDRAEPQVRLPRAGAGTASTLGAARRHHAAVLRARRRARRSTAWTRWPSAHLGHTCIPFTQVLEHAPGAKKSDKTFAQVPLDKATEYAGRGCRRDAAAVDGAEAAARGRAHDDRLRDAGAAAGAACWRDMERAGIKVDKAILSRLTSTFAQRVARLEEEIYELAGHKFNLGSPKQLGEFLFDNLKLPGGRKTKTGQWETRAGLLDDLAASEDLPEQRAQAHQRDAGVAAADEADVDLYRVAAAAHQSGDRAHPYLLCARPPPPPGASPPPIPTCRTSRSAPRKGARSARPSSPSAGHKLISADYSQIELRVLAHIADIPQLSKAFAEGLDIHAMTASEMFGVPIEGMPAEVRRRAKAINFGIIYGISAFGLAAQLGISKQEAGEYIATYFKRFPGIRDYMDATQESRRTSAGSWKPSSAGASTIPRSTPRTRRCAGSWSAPRSTRPIQGSAADIIRRAMIRMPRRAAGCAAEVRCACCCRCTTSWCSRPRPQTSTRPCRPSRHVMEKAAEPAVRLESAGPRGCQGRRQLGSGALNQALLDKSCKIQNGPECFPTRFLFAMRRPRRTPRPLLYKIFLHFPAVLQLRGEPTRLAATTRPGFARVVWIGVFGRYRSALAAAATEDIADFEARAGNQRLRLLAHFRPAAFMNAGPGFPDFELELLQLPQRHSVQLFRHISPFPCTKDVRPAPVWFNGK